MLRSNILGWIWRLISIIFKIIEIMKSKFNLTKKHVNLKNLKQLLITSLIY